MKTNQTMTNDTTRLVLKGMVTLLMVFQLAGCFVAGGEGGLANADGSIDNNLFEENILEENAAEESAIEESAVSAKGSLNWTAPVAREDETPISMAEIAGYRVHYGTTQGSYTQTININDAYIDEITFDVPDGIYYFVITTIDVDGRESAFSEEVVLTV
ncbi:MAG: fibronectin type III domain-containing protein [Proteobacteria bacterium]|nr:fibronectin type III domain-containing protein [Pseudomonadota bacterium]